MYGDPEVMRWLGDGKTVLKHPDELLSRVDRFSRHQDDYGYSLWAVVEKGTGEPIGHCGLIHLEEGPEIELGYSLKKKSWGRGYATEASRAALGAGFDRVGLRTIVALAYPDNARSRKVLEKLGMAHVGTAHHFGVDLEKYELSAP
jgi:ribosomal-protein-alanine N-acetyltransferase